jgi:predicted nucleic acid-binding protein
VLDAWAILAWLLREPRGPDVRALIERAAAGEVALHCSVITSGEVYYRLTRLRGRVAADTFWSGAVAEQSPIRLAAATTRRVEAAARLKSAHRVSYADGFAVGLAQELGAPLVTGDPEIKALADAGLVAVEWLGA